MLATSLSTAQRGGFHIWPEGQGEFSGPELSEALDLPALVEEPEGVPEPAGSPG